MASWRNFFTTGNNSDALPEWMSQNVNTAASQVIYYPTSSEHQNQYYVQEHSAGHQSNYRIYRDPYSQEYTIELLRLPICCDGCVEKIKSRLIDIDGVQAVGVNQMQKMVTVSGTPDFNEIFNACKKIFKKSKWQPN